MRNRFPILSQLTYLNSCSHGALSTDVREAYEQYLRDWEELGSPWELWGDFRGMTVLLFSSDEERQYGQVTRAILRAQEAERMGGVEAPVASIIPW